VPVWRPSNPSTVCSRRCVPSGDVPGDSAVVRAWLELDGDGAGLDCFLQIISEVLCIMYLELFVILFTFEVVSIRCNSTDRY
jgi:hypothetical protein